MTEYRGQHQGYTCDMCGLTNVVRPILPRCFIIRLTQELGGGTTLARAPGEESDLCVLDARRPASESQSRSQ